MAYGVKYQFSIESVNGDDVDIYLLQRNYSGQRYIRSLGRAPILKRERNDCILGTSLEIFAECRVDGEFAELYTSDAYEYKVEVYKRQILQWTGFVSPELYAEPDIAPPYDVQIIATDGLGELKNYDFEASTRKSIMTHIRSLLQHTGLSLSYKVISDLQFDDDGGRVDAEEAFIGAVVDIDNLVGESSYDVLQKLLRSIGACITQQEGRWYLIRESDLYYRLEDVNAAEFGSMNSCDWWPVGNLNADIMPAKNKIVITQKNSYKDNILPAVAEGINGGWSLLGGVYYDRDEACNILPNEQSSMAYTLISAIYPLRQPLMLTIKARCLTDIDGVTNSRIGIKVAAKGGVSSINASEFYLIYGKPAGYERYIPIWTAQSSGLGSSIVHSWEPPVVQFGDPDIEEIDIQIPLSDAGNGYYAYAYAEELEITVFNPSSDYPICVYECSLTQCHRPSGLELTANIGNNAREVYGDTEVMLASGDASLAVTMYGILVADGGITKWYSGNNSAESLLQLLALDIARQVALPRMRYRGKLNVPSMAVPEVPLLFFRDGTYYFLNTYSYDLLNDEVEVELISIPNAAVIIESESITELSPTTGGGSGNSGVAGGGGNDPGIIVDSNMSDESTNPVENRVIKAYVDGKAKDAQAAAEQYIQEEVLTYYATSKYVAEREEYLVGYTEEWVTDLEKDIKDNPQNYIGLKTINNQSLFGSGNLEVKTAVGWNNIVGRPTNLSEFTDDVVAGKYLPLTGGTIESAGIPLTIKRTNNSYSVISFYGIADSTSQHFGYLGFSGVDEPIYITSSGSERILIHSSNIRNYAIAQGGELTQSLKIYERLTDLWTIGGNSPYRLTILRSGGWASPLIEVINNYNVDSPDSIVVAAAGGNGTINRIEFVQGADSVDNTILRISKDNLQHRGHIILHDGNAYEYAVAVNTSINLATSCNVAGYGYTSSGWALAGAAMIIGANANYRMALQGYATNGNVPELLYNYCYNGVWHNWRYIAFIDSDITGNAATATDADMLDGKHLTDIMNIGFDNTLDLDTLYSASALVARYWVFANSSNISNQPWSNSAAQVWTLPGSYHLQIAKFYNSNDIRLRGLSGAGWTNWQQLAFTDSDITGYSAGLKHSNGTIGAIVNSSGNVTIGSGDLAGTTAKLYVNGKSYFGAYSDDGHYVRLGARGAYGLHIETRSIGNTYFQSQRFDSMTAYYNLVLQELGGNVSIGNTKIDSGAKLQVATTFRDTLPSLGSLGSGSDFAIQYTSTYACFGLYFSLDAQLGNTTIQTGRSDGGTATYALLLNPLGGNVGIGTTNPAYKLDVAGTGRFTDLIISNAFTLKNLAATGWVTAMQYVQSPDFVATRAITLGDVMITGWSDILNNLSGLTVLGTVVCNNLSATEGISLGGETINSWAVVRSDWGVSQEFVVVENVSIDVTQRVKKVIATTLNDSHRVVFNLTVNSYSNREWIIVFKTGPTVPRIGISLPNETLTWQNRENILNNLYPNMTYRIYIDNYLAMYETF